MNAVHKDILRKNHKYICDHLDLAMTNVLDKLLENNILDDRESKEILSKESHLEQNSRLLYILKRKPQFVKGNRKTFPFDAFLEALREEYWFIAERLLNELGDLNVEEKDLLSTRRSMCIYCFLIENLDPDDISTILYERQAFSDEDLESLISRKIKRPERVRTLLNLLHANISSETIYGIFTIYLKNEFNYTAEKTDFTEFTSCHCPSISKTNLSDLAAQLNLVPYRHNPMKTHFQIDNRLMRQLQGIWNTLWDLREEGNWEQLERSTKSFFASYKESPDIHVFLYRSKMGALAFYKEDYSKALEIFEEVKPLLSKTMIPELHLGRIFVLMANMYNRQSRFDEAESWMIEAHQAVENVELSLATGTVYFYEALCLMNRVRTGNAGDQSSVFLEKAKTCFITAFNHYSQERNFAVQSLQSEVYLFLALLELKIDFKTLTEIEVKKYSVIDMKLVKWCLDCFEENCWKFSSSWSKMLYSIARAEYHYRIKNTQRCLEYIKDARDISDAGSNKFKHKLPYIECRLMHMENQEAQPNENLDKINELPTEIIFSCSQETTKAHPTQLRKLEERENSATVPKGSVPNTNTLETFRNIIMAVLLMLYHTCLQILLSVFNTIIGQRKKDNRN